MTISRAEQASMIRKWYLEVIKNSAFTFVSNGDQFLTVHMKSPAGCGELTAKSQEPKAGVL